MSSNSTKVVDWQTPFAILVQLIGIMFVSFIAYVFIGLPIIRGGTSFAIVVVVCGFIGMLVWINLLFRTPLFEWWFINITQNHSAVLGSQLKRSAPLTDSEVVGGMYERVTLREVGAGIRGKLPWEIVVKVINTQSEILIGTPDDKPLMIYTKKGEEIELEVRWQVTLTPLIGYLTNLVVHTEDNVIQFFKGECESFIITWAKSMSEQEIMEAIGNETKIATEFKQLFGGMSALDDREKKYGIWTNQPQIVGVRRGKKYQESAEAGKVASNIAETIKQLRLGIGGDVSKLDPNILLLAGLAVSGRTEGLNPLIVAGLQGASAETLIAIKALQQKEQKKGPK